MSPRMSPPAAAEAPAEVLDAAVKYLNFMQNVRSASAQTLRAYESDLSQAFGFSAEFFTKTISAGTRVSGRPNRLSDDGLLVLCRAALSRWIPLAPASRNRKTACLKSFLNWLHEENAIERELAVQLHAPRPPVRLPHHISVDEVIALLDSVRRDEVAADTVAAKAVCVRDLTLLLLLYGGGLRVSEACGLRWSEIEKDGRLLRVVGKGGGERLIALPQLVATALARLKKDQGRTEFVFGDEALSTRMAYEIVRKRGVQCGLLKPLHPHALRHSYATHLLTSGANLRTLQELLGHRSLSATQRYTHLGIDHLARTMEQFHPLSTPGAARGSKKS